jgi:adenylate cyclase
METFFKIWAKAFHPALLVGLVTGALLYLVGTWAFAPTQQSEKQEMLLLSTKVGGLCLEANKSEDLVEQQKGVSRALDEALAHPRIVSVSFLSPAKEILALKSEKTYMPYRPSNEITFPITNPKGEFQGTLVLSLDGTKSSPSQSIARRVRWFSLFGFFLSTCVGLIFFKPPKDRDLMQILSAIRSISLGNLDVDLPPPENPDYAGLKPAFQDMVEGLKERERMRHSLGRIMDPKIAEILIKENPKVGGLRRQATILFCDMRNYTSLCEQLSSDELQEFLNRYWKETVEIIMQEEGTIDKFHGDGVCVVFGAPVLHGDDPLRAVRTAWRLVQNVDRLNKDRVIERKIPIQIGIGIHSGEVIAGNIGSERRMEYTVVGDVVNVAARIEELNKKFGTKVLISDNVYEQVEDFVRVKTLTLAHLRGHKRPVLVHTLREVIEFPAQE